MALFSQKTRMMFLFLILPCMVSAPAAWASDWQMTFDVSVPDTNADGGVLVSRLEAGSMSTATDGYDNDADVLALPEGPVQAAFTHESETTYPASLQLLWRDMRGRTLPQHWTIKVNSFQSTAPVTVGWGSPPSIGSDACHTGSIRLQDQTSGQLIDLSGSPYSYASTGTSGSPETRYFVLTVESVVQNAPDVPSGLMSRSRKGGIRLKWAANSETDLGGYHVWRSLVSGSGYERLTTAPVLENRYADQATATGMTYYYVVTAMGANGCESGFSQQTVAIAK
ncbi:MAG: hypothetical protein HY349_00530 [Nitrospirae bacterium]|nr:hypothetical protein [Nitrospirota bacterium]